MSSESLQALVALCVRPAQELEDACAAVREAFDPATSVGVQLTTVGSIVGEPRQGRGDAAYRAFIFARIAANTSDGHPTQLYAAARALLGDVGHTLRITTAPPANYELEVGGLPLACYWEPAADPATVADALADVVLAATSGGVSLQMVYQVADDAHTFTFASGDLEEDDTNRGLADADDELDLDGGLFVGVVLRE